MKLNFKNQMIISCAIIILFNLLNTIFKHWIFTSIGFCICGLLYLIHPVMPKNAVVTKKGLIAIRFTGIVLILIGIFIRSYLY